MMPFQPWSFDCNGKCMFESHQFVGATTSRNTASLKFSLVMDGYHGA